VLRINDDRRVRVLTLDRPAKLNAFNEALYDAATEALIDAAGASHVAVVVLTGTGRAFSAGTDVAELTARTADPASFRAGLHGFPGFVGQLADFPKPLLCAVNGMALGIGATLLGFADLVVMSSRAKVRCPFTDLGVAPEAASSYLLPLMIGRQNASWLLLSSDWLSAQECERIGLAWRVTAPGALLLVTMEVAQHLAAKPIASLVETKRAIISAHRDLVAAAREREDLAFSRLLGQPANLEALAALSERRCPDFAAVDAANPPDLERHRVD
jgi:enoyl-CoA hydratase/carnithine racemase